MCKTIISQAYIPVFIFLSAISFDIFFCVDESIFILASFVLQKRQQQGENNINCLKLDIYVPLLCCVMGPFFPYAAGWWEGGRSSDGLPQHEEFDDRLIERAGMRVVLLFFWFGLVIRYITHASCYSTSFLFFIWSLWRAACVPSSHFSDCGFFSSPAVFCFVVSKMRHMRQLRRSVKQTHLAQTLL